jgi:hypothetical protein
MVGLASVGPLSCVALSMRGRARRSVRTRTGCGVLTAPASERNSVWSVIVPADGTKGCHCRDTETSVRLRFLGSSRTSRCLLVSDHMGCGAQSTMAGRKLNAKHLLGVAQFANAPPGQYWPGLTPTGRS